MVRRHGDLLRHDPGARRRCRWQRRLRRGLGHQTLNFYGTTGTYVPAGLSGLTLLDPADFTVNSDNVGSIQSSLASGNFLISTVGTTGTAPGDIFVNAAMTWNSAGALTLQSAHDIAINGDRCHQWRPGARRSERDHRDGRHQSRALRASARRVDAGGSVAAELCGDRFPPPWRHLPAGARRRRLQASPYQIADVYGLQGIGSPSGALLNKNFVLANDINASGTAAWNGGARLRTDRRDVPPASSTAKLRPSAI